MTDETSVPSHLDRILFLARQDAEAIVEIARESAEPVEFITGNSHMPPLRAFGSAEIAWHYDETLLSDAWSYYVEELESILERESVLLECPEYDNALYVVDLRRWQYVDEDDSAEYLSDQWAPIDPPDTRTFDEVEAEGHDGSGRDLY